MGKFYRFFVAFAHNDNCRKLSSDLVVAKFGSIEVILSEVII